jgi:hypothetical protein
MMSMQVLQSVLKLLEFGRVGAEKVQYYSLLCPFRALLVVMTHNSKAD